MAAGFQVEPEQLDAFTENLQRMVDVLTASKAVLNGIHFDPLVFGVIGQFFTIASRDKVREAAECVAKLEKYVAEAKVGTQATADTYRNTDQHNADAFAGGKQ